VDIGSDEAGYRRVARPPHLEPICYISLYKSNSNNSLSKHMFYPYSYTAALDLYVKLSYSNRTASRKFCVPPILQWYLTSLAGSTSHIRPPEAKSKSYATRTQARYSRSLVLHTVVCNMRTAPPTPTTRQASHFTRHTRRMPTTHTCTGTQCGCRRYRAKTLEVLLNKHSCRVGSVRETKNVS
jgi:hypothetical protein